MEKSVYLAGPIGGCSYKECTDWREEMTESLAEDGIVCYSPMRYKEYLSDCKKLGSVTFGRKEPFSKPQAVLTRDRWDCQRASVVVANLLGTERVSIGTVMELAWADSVRTPIVLVIEESGNIHDHALVRGVCGFQVDSLAAAEQVVRGLLN